MMARRLWRPVSASVSARWIAASRASLNSASVFESQGSRTSAVHPVRHANTGLIVGLICSRFLTHSVVGFMHPGATGTLYYLVPCRQCGLFRIMARGVESRIPAIIWHRVFKKLVCWGREEGQEFANPGSTFGLDINLAAQTNMKLTCSSRFKFAGNLMQEQLLRKLKESLFQTGTGSSFFLSSKNLNSFPCRSFHWIKTRRP